LSLAANGFLNGVARLIAISLGDVTGIGPEVALKALAAERDADDTHYLLIGDEGYLERENETLGLHLPLQAFDPGNLSARFFFHNPLTKSLAATLAPGSPTSAHAALVWLTEGAQRCLRYEVDALVTAPVNKEAIIRAGNPFIGQTEYLATIAGVKDTIMMLL